MRQAVGGSTQFGVLYLTQFFFQIPLAPDSRPHTAIGTMGTRLYQYKTVPPGFSISIDTLQSALTSILPDYYWRNEQFLEAGNDQH